MAERLKALIVADKDNVGVRQNLGHGVLRDGDFEVIGLSRLKISRIRKEIKPKHPDVVLISAALKNEQEIDVLRGFVRKLQKHLADTKVVIHGPDIDRKEEIGASGWINEALPHELLSSTLKRITEE